MTSAGRRAKRPFVTAHKMIQLRLEGCRLGYRQIVNIENLVAIVRDESFAPKRIGAHGKEALATNPLAMG